MQYGHNIVVPEPKYSKMNAEMVMSKYADLFQTDAPPSMSTKVAATKILRFYAEKVLKPIGERKGFNLASCDVCQALTDADLDACPLCGDGADVIPAAEAFNRAMTVGHNTSQQRIDNALLKRSERDLDDAMSAVRASIDDAVLSFYSVGELVSEIMEKQLWRLRTNAFGLPAYKNPAEFAREEIGKSIGYVNGAIRVVKAMPLERVRELGIRDAIRSLTVNPAAPRLRPSMTTLVFDRREFLLPLQPEVQVLDDYGVPIHLGATSVAQKPSAELVFPNGTRMSFELFTDDSGELQLKCKIQDK